MLYNILSSSINVFHPYERKFKRSRSVNTCISYPIVSAGHAYFAHRSRSRIRFGQAMDIHWTYNHMRVYE